ncbi:MAG: GntR family transcriptional regulator [Clostridia bacterium]|nr:GntR family transcriptional regulator [Clostridia bacterium]MBQ8258838.1 GntR family transcriptional regulator [Clostridia bacterium]MBR4061554.1 GntR family transcriptional regulator [Clostridia bacterium]
MLIVIDHNSRIPIYEQIKTQIIALINSGVLAPGDKLPSLRALASDLSLNFNTIKKVFALLEADGVIESRQGAGFFVTAGAVENKNVLAKAEEELRLTLARVRDAGLSEEAATRILSEIYTKEEE